MEKTVTAKIRDAENEWVHLAATYDGGTASSGCKIYLNGVPVDDADYQNVVNPFVTVRDLGHAVWIGRYSTTYSNGKIDNILIHRRVLGADEISSFYHSQRFRYNI